MAIIINITEYLKQKNQKNLSREPNLRNILGPAETWGSEEEELRYYMELAEQDRKAEGLV
ncbi:MAG: hypothetical protein LBI03_02960 [Clostridiales bacterium]|nr:hypothetical protein [Clostridiales bacterium]